MEPRSKNQEIKGYKLLGIIAKGGMGEVYKGIHPVLNKEVILKKLNPNASQVFFERFKREASLMMEVSHPNIVHIFDYFKEGSNSYIVMEYIAGYNLSEITRKLKKLPVFLAAYIALEIAKALQYAHSKGIIHRDIKPANILISTQGEVKLSDFGIAFKNKRDSEEEDITRTGTFLGTPAYMSPEQIYSSKDVDHQTDIYSLGVIFYEMLTGEKPYSNEISMENIIRIRKGKCRPIKKYNSRVPDLLISLIKKMMSPRKSQRIQKIETVIKRLQWLLSVKFKNKELTKEYFQNIIVKNNPVVELKYFEYPGVLMTLQSAAKTALLLTPLLILFGVLWNFFPDYLIRWTFSKSLGLVNFSMINQKKINYGYLELRLQKNPIIYYRVDLKKDQFTYKKNNIIIFAGKYNASLFIHEQFFYQEMVVLPYDKIKKSNSLEFIIDNPMTKTVNLNLKVINFHNGLPVENPNIYYKLKYSAIWDLFNDKTRIQSGETYDVFVSAPGFNSTAVNTVYIPENQTDVDISFQLIHKRVLVKIRKPEEPLNLRIDDQVKGYIDPDGIHYQSFERIITDTEIFIDEGLHNFVFVTHDKKYISSINKKFTVSKVYEMNFDFNKDQKELFISVVEK